jgi:ubiquinol-cytochrome c reductase iron-sulfur subunit
MHNAPWRFAEVNADKKQPSSRRDFLFLATGAFGATGVAFAAWPFVDSFNPAADARALSSVEVDLNPIQIGQRITVKWGGKPVFITRRTEREIAEAKSGDSDDMIDPALDSERAERAEWLIVIGICTHFGCIPLGQKDPSNRGKWSGWVCPCHGSVYDIAGRVRRGPAPRNLDIPPYGFGPNGALRIG